MLLIGCTLYSKPYTATPTCLSHCCSGVAGEVPSLFTPEEMAALADSQHQAATTAALQGSLAAPATPFWERVRVKLHIILSMDPASPAFCERCRLFPGELVSFSVPVQSAQDAAKADG